jgi:hypothetical protein
MNYIQVLYQQMFVLSQIFACKLDTMVILCCSASFTVDISLKIQNLSLESQEIIIRSFKPLMQLYMTASVV